MMEVARHVRVFVDGEYVAKEVASAVLSPVVLVMAFWAAASTDQSTLLEAHTLRSPNCRMQAKVLQVNATTNKTPPRVKTDSNKHHCKGTVGHGKGEDGGQWGEEGGLGEGEAKCTADMTHVTSSAADEAAAFWHIQLLHDKEVLTHKPCYSV